MAICLSQISQAGGLVGPPPLTQHFPSLGMNDMRHTLCARTFVANFRPHLAYYVNTVVHLRISSLPFDQQHIPLSSGRQQISKANEYLCVVCSTVQSDITSLPPLSLPSWSPSSFSAFSIQFQLEQVHYATGRRKRHSSSASLSLSAGLRRRLLPLP